MKKVLFTATVDSHILNFHLPYLQLFKEDGYEVHVATNGIEKIPFCDKKHTINFERSPYKINNLKAIKQLKRIIDKENFDIIHCHTPMGSVVTRIAATKARKKGTKVFYTAHGFHFYKGASLINWLLFYPVEKYLAKYTDTLITINKEDYTLAKNKFSKRCKNIEYVPGVGINPEKFNFKMSDKEKYELRESLGLKNDDFVMIFPARLDKNKNQIMLIKVMKELVRTNKNFKLLLPGTDELNGYYQKITKENGLEDYIKFLGNRDDIPRLLKISNLAVSSSKREGLPVNIMEAIVCNLPVVSTNCRGASDLIENGINGYLVDINDVNSFIDRVENIYNNKINYSQMKEYNYKKIKEVGVENILNKEKRIIGELYVQN